MCTLTYLPLSQTGHQYILTVSRDVGAERKAATFPVLEKINEREVLFPRDGEAGGTWLAAASDGLVTDLMNGAFTRHIPNPPYRKSRGLIVLDLFTYQHPDHFTREHDFEGIEPFTMVIFHRKGNVGALRIVELRWDGTHRHIKEYSPESPYIWSSTPLYDEEAQERRSQWFQNWLVDQESYSVPAIRQFHYTAGQKEDPYNALVMNRGNIVKTVSVTTLEVDQESIRCWYQAIGASAPSEATLVLNK